MRHAAAHKMVRRLLAPLVFFISILLSAQAFAFDVDGLSYTVITGTTNVRVEGCAADPCPSSDVVIPATVVDSGIVYDVKIIGNRAFQSNALTSVVIPDSVTTLGGFSFAGNALTSVVIPDSVTIIGGAAFRYNAFTSVTIPDSVTTIGNRAFRPNDLTSVLFPDSVTFRYNALTSAAFEGNFGDFDLDMFNFLHPVPPNPNVATITYCEGTTGWPQSFNIGSKTITTTPVDCSTAPDAPTIDSIAPGNAQATVSFTSGANNGSPITNYQHSLDGFVYTALSPANPVSPITITGLTNGTDYFISLIAVNALGESVASNRVSVIVVAAPDGPTIDSIAAGDGQAVITFTPGADNGSPITFYTAYCIGATRAGGASTTSPITVSGLTSGEAYVCLVTATNDIGHSPISEASGVSVTPVAPPPGC